jgi:hypothetical protein
MYSSDRHYLLVGAGMNRHTHDQAFSIRRFKYVQWQAMNARPTEYFFKTYNATWPFQGRLSIKHTVPNAAVYNVTEHKTA